MDKKGFTLIELLAVIVILAIIALIATPIVLNIIKDSKDSAIVQSAEFYLGAVETAVAKQIIDDPTFKPSSCEIQSDGNLKCDEVLVKLEINGENPSSGNITIEQGKIKDVSLILSGKKFIKDGDKLLEPGLYDAEGNLLYTWNQLVNDFDIDVSINIASNNKLRPGEILSSNEDLSKGVKLVIDSSVTKIGNNVFYGCTSLMEVIIPNSVISLGSSVFNSCTNLTKITVPNSVTTVGQSLFQNCTSLEKIVLPNSLINLSNNMFKDCTSLKEITIPSGVTNLNPYLFTNCTNLEIVILPNSVASIGDFVFNGCASLKEITIPNSVINIGRYSFSGTSLKIINYVGTEQQWVSIDFKEGWSYLLKPIINYNYAVK